MIVKFGHAYDLPLERHSIEYFVDKKVKGNGWRGDPLEVHLELEEIGRWLLPNKSRAKKWEKYFGGVLFPKPLQIISSIVNGYKELREIDETNEEFISHVDLLNKNFPIKERRGSEEGQYVYLLKCKKRDIPLVLPEILKQNKRGKYKP